MISQINEMAKKENIKRLPDINLNTGAVHRLRTQKISDFLKSISSDMTEKNQKKSLILR